MENATLDRKALLLQRFSSTIAQAAIKLQENIPHRQSGTAPITPTPFSYVLSPSSDNLLEQPVVAPPTQVMPPCISLPSPPSSKKARLLGAPTKKVEAPRFFPCNTLNPSPPTISKKLHLLNAAPAKNARGELPCCSTSKKQPSETPPALVPTNDAMSKKQCQEKYKPTAFQCSKKRDHVLEHMTQNLPQASHPLCINTTEYLFSERKLGRTLVQSKKKDAGKAPQPKHRAVHATHPLPKAKLPHKKPSGLQKEMHKRVRPEENYPLMHKRVRPEENYPFLHGDEVPQPERNQDAPHTTPQAPRPLSKKKPLWKDAASNLRQAARREIQSTNKRFLQEDKAPQTKKNFLQEDKAPQSGPNKDAMHATLEIARKIMQEKVLKQRHLEREEARRALEAVERNATIEDAWQTTTEFLQLLTSTSQYARCEVPLERTYASNLDCAGRLHINFLGTA